MKNFLYTVSLVLLLVAAYFIYNWFILEPENREPLPALLILLSSLITMIIAWQSGGDNKNSVKVKNIRESTVDIDQEKDSVISVSNVKENSFISISL